MIGLIAAIVIALALFCLFRQITWPLIKIGLAIIAIGAAVELVTGSGSTAPPKNIVQAVQTHLSANTPLATALQKANALYSQ